MKIIKQSIICLTPSNWYADYERINDLAGRVCYKSEAKITDETTHRFIRALIKSGHESVLEHVSLTFRFITDRAIANALVRHRHCSFSQESTHYINYAKKKELTFIHQMGVKDFIKYTKELKTIEDNYFACKEGHMQARAMLPLAMKTELVMTTNLREWRSILKIRIFGKDHPQMTECMRKLYNWFKINMPIFVEDIEYDFGQRQDVFIDKE